MPRAFWHYDLQISKDGVIVHTSNHIKIERVDATIRRKYKELQKNGKASLDTDVYEWTEYIDRWGCRDGVPYYCQD
jgi:hypothetical protein